MEQGHGQVPHVVGPDVEDHGHAVAGGEQAALGAAHRLGRGRRPRGEQQHPQGVDVGLEARVPRPRRPRRQRLVERLAHGALPVVGVGEALGHEQAAREVERRRHRRQQLLVARLGDEQLHVGVGDVGQEVLVAAGVVEPHHHRPDEAGGGQGEDVVGGVVEEHGHVRRPGRVEALAEQGGQARHLGEHLTVRPRAVPEPHGRPPGVLGVGAVAAHQGGGVGGRERRRPRRRCQGHAPDHLRRGHDMGGGQGM